MNKKDNFYVPLIVVLSTLVPLLVAALMLFPETLRFTFGNADLRSLPFFHAVLNGSTAILLLTGVVLIKNKKIAWHRTCMLIAFALSAVFLVSYVISKLSNDPAPFLGVGLVRYVYFFILITHIILSISVLPLALFAIYRGVIGDYHKHVKIVKWAFPVWLYVSVTGVLVYIFMIPYYS